MDNIIRNNLENDLKSILKEETNKIKASVKEYIKKDSSKGISQMIGRRYGNLWQRLVIEVFSYTDTVKIGKRILYKDYVETWADNNIDDKMGKCCSRNSRIILKKFLAENTGTDKQDLCDFSYIMDVERFAVDTKWRFISNDSNTVREIANSAKHLKFMNYNPILLIRKEKLECLQSPLKRFEKEGWNIKYGQISSDFVYKVTSFNLGEWIDNNIDMWRTLVDYQEELIKLRFGEKDWKF